MRPQRSVFSASARPTLDHRGTGSRFFWAVRLRLLETIAAARVDLHRSTANDDRPHAMFPRTDDMQHDGSQRGQKRARALRHRNGIAHPCGVIARQCGPIVALVGIDRERREHFGRGRRGRDETECEQPTIGIDARAQRTNVDRRRRARALRWSCDTRCGETASREPIVWRLSSSA